MTLRETVRSWIARLSEPQDVFGGLAPCPFASKASVAYFECDSALHAFRILSGLESVDSRAVIVIGVPTNIGVSRTTFLSECRRMVEDRDIVVMLSDHRNPMVIGGYRTTQATRLLVIAQSASALREASKGLEGTAYYKNWTQEQRDSISV